MRIQKYLVAILTILLISSGAVARSSPPEKLKPEEVVAKHLAAIGPADALTNLKSIVAVGEVKALSKTSAIKDLPGIAQLVSEGNKVVLAMIFYNSVSYPYEKAGFDGQKMTVSLLEPSAKRSALGDFLISKDVIFKDGLIGGVLSASWPLLNLASKNPKLSYSGTKKMGDRQVHELKYSARKGGDLTISLFFDAETFRHVRTEYSYSVSARMGGRPTDLTASRATEQVSGIGSGTGSQTLYRYKLIEEFSDFQTVDKLTLPHHYKLRLSVDAQGPLLVEWDLNFKQFTFNQAVEATAFNVSSTK